MIHFPYLLKLEMYTEEGFCIRLFGTDKESLVRTASKYIISDQEAYITDYSERTEGETSVMFLVKGTTSPKLNKVM